MKRTARSSARAATRLGVVLVLVTIATPAAAGPLRDALARRVTAPTRAEQPASARRHSPRLFWGGLALTGFGTFVATASMFSERCTAMWAPGVDQCERFTNKSGVAWGIVLASGGIPMMAIGGRHDKRASVDVAPTRVRLRVRF